MIFPAAARLSVVKFTQQLRKVTALEGVQETESRFVLVVFFSPPTLPLSQVALVVGRELLVGWSTGRRRRSLLKNTGETTHTR